MCGICGIRDPRGVDGGVLDRMTDILAHRGPDDRGIWIGDGVGFGHRRLSIIDLAGGRQPMTTADGSLTITFNGEIYNYRELRERLEADGRRFATQSDTEVILALYEKTGVDCVDSLRGMFAFAIHDARSGRIFVARDHFGQKPLFFTHDGGRFAFASEIKALLAFDPSLREINQEALHQYLTLRIIAPPRTMFRRIQKLAPGHRLVFEDGAAKIDRYWNLSYEPKHSRSEETLLDELEDHARDAVRHCMVSDVPVGAFLSGGLDSGLVVGLMAESEAFGRANGNHPFPTFSGSVPYADYDESPAARLVNARYGTEEHIVDLDIGVNSMLPEITWHLDEPADPLSLCSYVLSSAARRSVKVVLAGDGGDELFGGYDRYSGHRYLDRYALLPRALREHVIRRLIDHVPDSFSQKSLSQRLQWVNSISLAKPENRYARSLGHFFFTPRMRDELYGDGLKHAVAAFDPEEALSHYFAAEPGRATVDRMLNADSMIRLPDHALMILDRMSMAHGLEARAPFLDHELAAFAAKLPADLKVNGSRLRYLQRRLGERYLPDEVLNSQKRGFSSGISYLLAREYGTLFERMLGDSRLVRDGYLRLPAIRRIFDEHLQHRVDHNSRIWLLCHAEVWYRMMIEGAEIDELRETIA